MRTIATKIFITLFVVCFTSAPAVYAKGDDFNSVVKMIEEFYRVKHVGIPFLAKAGMKVATTAARIKGGTARRLAEAGSIKLAVFENQEFNGDFRKFRSSLNQALNVTWMPLIQTLSAAGEEQTYIFLRNDGDKTKVLVITIDERDATVVQVNLSQKNLALLLKDPEGTGKAITEEATLIDQE
ncbi:MAG TPA: hypothetical protein VFT48_16035 [Pyrinomonadaceae bacterium]|nr:hypothetical protein [Pyrinomonadaceae bacterium]